MFKRFRRNKEASAPSQESMERAPRDNAANQRTGSRLTQIGSKLAGGESIHRDAEAQLDAQLEDYESTERALDDRERQTNDALDSKLSSLFADTAKEYAAMFPEETQQETPTHEEPAETPKNEEKARKPWRMKESYFQFMEDHPEKFILPDFPGYYPELTEDLQKLLSSDMPIDELRSAIDTLKSQTDKAREAATDSGDFDLSRSLLNKSDALGRTRSYLGYGKEGGLDRRDILRELQIREKIGRQYYEDHKDN
jgi:hypothetical protein